MSVLEDLSILGASFLLLLVSVRSASEASAAIAGGAHVIDAKDPSEGPLGAVTIDQLREIQGAIAGRRPLSAALGEVSSASRIEREARAYAGAGAELVKIGFAGISRTSQIAALVRAAVRGAKQGSDGKAGVVAVTYADAPSQVTPMVTSLLDAAANAGAAGLLVDTWNKDGAGLLNLLPYDTLSLVVGEGHQRGMFVALAGRLSSGDLVLVRQTGADVAGVRGAACVGGRNGRVTAARVRQLRALCASPIVMATSQTRLARTAERSSSRRSAGTTTGVT